MDFGANTYLCICNFWGLVFLLQRYIHNHIHNINMRPKQLISAAATESFGTSVL